MLLNDCKAGMQDIDKPLIESIIRKNTGTNYYSHQQKKQQRIDKRIERNRRLLASTSADQLAIAERKMDILIDRLEASRDISQTAVHVDMDAFYAAVEMRDDPQLRTIPMGVGSDSMLSTSNYLARRFGIRAAMPGFIARKLCPQLVIVPCDFEKYRAASHLVRSVFADYDPNYSMASLDEAYLDLTECRANRVETRKSSSFAYSYNVKGEIFGGGLKILIQREFGKGPLTKQENLSFPPKQPNIFRFTLPDHLIENHRRVRYAGDCLCRLPRIIDKDDEHSTTTTVCEKCGRNELMCVDEVQFGCDIESIVAEMRFRVEQLTGLTCSAGIAPNSMLAKICSDTNKPNGQYYLRSDIDAIREFLENLPIRKVNGIGAVSEHLLKAIGVDKCGQLHDKRAELAVIFGEPTAEYLMRVCLGSGWTSSAESTSQQQVHERKSISVERTFAPTNDVNQLISICRSLCDTLADQVHAKKIKGKTLTLKLKLSSFDVRTRNISTQHSISSAVAMSTFAEQLLRKEIADNTSSASIDLRLIGIRLSNLISSCEHQMDIRRYFNGRGDEEKECAMCPVCCESTIAIRNINEHIDKCLLLATANGVEGNNTAKGGEEKECAMCPVGCKSTIPIRLMNEHIDKCLLMNTANDDRGKVVKRNAKSTKTKTKTRCLESYFIRR